MLAGHSLLHQSLYLRGIISGPCDVLEGPEIQLHGRIFFPTLSNDYPIFFVHEIMRCHFEVCFIYEGMIQLFLWSFQLKFRVVERQAVDISLYMYTLF